MKTKQGACVMVGGFLGPFAGQSLATILPEFADSFEISIGQAAATMSFYLLPFAVMMLFSNRLVVGLSPSRVSAGAFAVTSVAAVVLVLTPWWELFLVAFVIMGMANAFTTPLLQIILKHLTPTDQLGGTLGTYTAVQSLGILSAPLLAGLAASWNWRIVFVVVAILAAVIVLVRLPYVPAQAKVVARAEPVRWAATIVHMCTCWAIGFGVIGLGFLVALHAEDRFHLGPVGRGLLLMCGGLAAFLFSGLIGTIADKTNPRKVLVISAATTVVTLLVLPVAPNVWSLALFWGVTVAAVQGVQTMVNYVVLYSPGGSSLLSTVQAFRYFGSSSTPLLLLTVYYTIGSAAFLAPAAAVLVALILQGLVNRGGNAGNRRLRF